MANEPVLLVIDVQQGFRDTSYWGVSANPNALVNISMLVDSWRSKGFPVVIVKHNSSNPDSPLSPSGPGNQLEDFLVGPHEAVIQKSVNSAFYGTPDLHLWLTKRNFRKLVICGITTNLCCETTARMAGNLGYQTSFVIDATDAFDLSTASGEVISGERVMQLTAANLNGEFANVITTEAVLESFIGELSA